MTVPFEIITDVCDQFLKIDKDAISSLDQYAKLLCEWNEKMNLTAITDPEGIAIKHFLDCLMLFKYVDIPIGSSIIDVGTGAGFPGMVLKIVRPDIQLTLLDSLNKRISFLDTVASQLGIEVNTLHSRAEDAANGNLREFFDFAVARAVANMRVLSEYCLPFVKTGGSFIAMKGSSAQNELNDAQKSISLLGGKSISCDTFSLANSGERAIITVKKISQTPTKFPRSSAKISKLPL